MSDREAWITFAAAAYTGWLANGDHYNVECRNLAVDDADALLAELNKRHPLPSPAPPQPDAVSDQLAAALAGLLRRDEINTCQHENTHRGGVIWTICDDCGAKFADDTNPWKPFVEPREWADGYAALAAYRALSKAGVTK